MSKRLLYAALERARFLKGPERLGLLKQMETLEAFRAIKIDDWPAVLGRPVRASVHSAAVYIDQAEADFRRAETLGIAGVAYDEAAYPPLLREMVDPPLFLYYRGVLPNPEKPLAAVVGTRRPSADALRRAYRFGRDFAAASIAVVSGLALGIDAQAHRGNVDGGAPSAAVLGSGLDRIYPATNKALALRLLDVGGVLFSEYQPGEPPERYHFPERNRLIAALARATIVVEAPEKSGALITAEFAYELGRDLWVDRAGLESPLGAGLRRLAADGAPLAEDARSVLADWGWPLPQAEKRPLTLGGGSDKETGNYGAVLARRLEEDMRGIMKPRQGEL